MYNYKTLTKSQMIELVNLIENVLLNSSSDTLGSSKRYSNEIKSQLAFEVGHLNGSIKEVLNLIAEYKKM